MDQVHSPLSACLTSGSDPGGHLDQMYPLTLHLLSLWLAGQLCLAVLGMQENPQAPAGSMVQNSDPSQEF